MAQEAAALVTEYLVATLEYGPTAAARLGGVSRQKYYEWKMWQDGGADPKLLPPLRAEKVRGLRDCLKMLRDSEVRQAALMLAADRLESLADEMRTEAKAPAREGVRSAAARRAVQKGKAGQKSGQKKG